MLERFDVGAFDKVRLGKLGSRRTRDSGVLALEWRWIVVWVFGVLVTAGLVDIRLVHLVDGGEFAQSTLLLEADLHIELDCNF
jgi:hypothetical protein